MPTLILHLPQTSPSLQGTYNAMHCNKNSLRFSSLKAFIGSGNTGISIASYIVRTIDRYTAS